MHEIAFAHHDFTTGSHPRRPLQPLRMAALRPLAACVHCELKNTTIAGDDMAISQKIKDLINSAWVDGYVCLLATVGPEGPNVSPKGSMLFFDDDHLAYWERSKKKALENLLNDDRVAVVYSNMPAQRSGELESGILRFYGKAELHESGAIHDAIFAKLTKREQEHEGADTGIGVLIKIERALDGRGKSFN
jgi:hypothetical protein